MSDRDPKTGRFQPGNKASPGRKPRATEQEYLSGVGDIVPLERFLRQVEAIAKRADRGDIVAFNRLVTLLGLEIIKQDITINDTSANYEERLAHALSILEAARARADSNPTE